MKQKRSKKQNFFKSNYAQSWNYIKESKNFIYIVVLIFLIFSLIGFFIPTPDVLEKQILQFIHELLEKTKGMTSQELISFIFFNNLQSSFFGMIFGLFLGIFPIIAAIANGYLLGFVASVSVASEGGFVLLKLFPHGIFELPAIFISLGLGLKLGTIFLKKRKFDCLKEYLFNSLKVFVLIVLPLLIIAAIIEGILI